MARQINRLSARTVASLTGVGRHADGGGLYLVIDKNGSKRWAYLYRQAGRLREMGLGGLASVPLSRARERAKEIRERIAEGADPIAERRTPTPAPRATPTFGAVADGLIASLQPSWRNSKHAAQWKMTLQAYAEPLRAKPIDEVDTQAVLQVLQPLWKEKPETASRLRGRIERVLDSARVQGLRDGPNPAAWRGHLDHVLPARGKLGRGHHRALPYREVPGFVAQLRAVSGLSTLALEFAILTAARSGEVLGATWDEVDIDRAIWSVPGERMKSGRPHRVPLPERAVGILIVAQAVRREGQGADYVFPGQRPGRPLSSMSLEMAMRRLAVDGTPHGFRSSFRDWASESGKPREVAELCLAHTVGDATERAYARSDLLDLRRAVLHEWAAFCEPRVAGPHRKESYPQA